MVLALREPHGEAHPVVNRQIHFSEVGGSYGGYNQDHEFFGERHSI